ncbi:voltage-dependent calcium channel subunit alpha-2/delta-3 [Cricetulus griseus]|nr:voltage-dependent calcium channel subunit alpha-2/delta-3 [Cricetulus griseus]
MGLGSVKVRYCWCHLGFMRIESEFDAKKVFAFKKPLDHSSGSSSSDPVMFNARSPTGSVTLGGSRNFKRIVTKDQFRKKVSLVLTILANPVLFARLWVSVMKMLQSRKHKRVKLWASAFGGEIKSIAAKYSGSQLLQKDRVSKVKRLIPFAIFTSMTFHQCGNQWTFK